jgi:hypothetical protein
LLEMMGTTATRNRQWRKMAASDLEFAAMILASLLGCEWRRRTLFEGMDDVAEGARHPSALRASGRRPLQVLGADRADCGLWCCCYNLESGGKPPH